MASKRRGLSVPETIRVLLLGVLVAVMGSLSAAGVAKAAETHTITVDNGRLTMGYVFLNNQILPADVPGPLDPMRSNTSPNGTIKVETNGSTAKVAEEDFDMPVVWIPDPTAGGAPIPLSFKPVGGLDGNWNPATGALVLKGTLQVDVIWGYNDEGPQICRFNAADVTWTTAGNAISPGVAFNSAQGLAGKGAISAFWNSLPSGESINGGSCAKPNAVVRDAGAVWLSSGIEEIPPPPTCQEQGMEGLWPDCYVDEWPEPEPNEVVKISQVRVSKATIRAGKKGKLTVRITNTGKKAAKGIKVTLSSNKSSVKVPRQAKLNVPPGKTAKLTVTVRTTKSAKGSATITAKVAGKTGKGKVKVKAVKRKAKR